MLEVICTIPENFGWMIVGALAVVAVMATVKLGKTIGEAIIERLCDEEEGF